MDADALVCDYLQRLDDAAQALIPEQADDLVADVREHIETAIAEANEPDEAAVRSVLDRLGPPEAIAIAAVDGRPDVFRARTSPLLDDRPALWRLGPWVLGALAGVVGGLAWALPGLFVDFGLPGPGVPLLVAVAVVALLLLRRPEGAKFLATTLAVTGALAVVVEVASSLSSACPEGTTCSGPSLAPVIVPGLGLIVVGVLMAGRVVRQS